MQMNLKLYLIVIVLLSYQNRLLSKFLYIIVYIQCIYFKFYIIEYIPIFISSFISLSTYLFKNCWQLLFAFNPFTEWQKRIINKKFQISFYKSLLKI